MSIARPLAAEREYCHLDRTPIDAMAPKAAAVAALDARLAQQPLPLALDEHEDFTVPGWTLFRLERGGIVHLPTGVLSPRVRGLLYDLMRAVENER